MGIEESALVVGTHVLSLSGFLYVACSWREWVARQFNDLFKTPIGLLLMACLVFSVMLAITAGWYGAARLLEPAIDLRTQEYAYLLTVLRGLAPLGFLLMMIARWRLEDRDPATVKRCTLVAVSVGAMIYIGTVAVLW